MSIDFRSCLNALSDVIINRPPPLRHFDQIYMKLPDMLLQAELIGRWFHDKDVIFIGDGDAIALAVGHLHASKDPNGKPLLAKGPRHIHVMDFDERMVNSINQFAWNNKLRNAVSASLYNVADPLPLEHWQQYDAFYTNP